MLPLPYLETLVDNVRNSLNPEIKDLIDRCQIKSLVSMYSVLMQHQQAKINSYLDSQQTLRPPSYNSITRQPNHTDIPSISSQYHNGSSLQSLPESTELLQDVIAVVQQNVLLRFSLHLLTFFLAASSFGRGWTFGDINAFRDWSSLLVLRSCTKWKQQIDDFSFTWRYAR